VIVGEPEIEYFNRAVGSNLHIRGLQIAMDDPELVRGLQCLSGIAQGRLRQDN
jgi:hypothetical protein